ncbi:hypothetical protein ACVI1J_005163 [Bradyrhizobium diazoefficiens]
MSPVTLIISPYRSQRTGKRVHGQFEARLDGELVCISRQPLLDGARVLLAGGADPATPIAMRHQGSAHDAMRSTVGVAAEMRVEENETDGPRFVRWKAPSGSDGDAPVRFSGALVPDTGQHAERRRDGAAT